MRAHRLTAVFLFGLLLQASAFGEGISFSAGKTDMVMKGSRKEVSLTGGARISTGDITIDADNVRIFGEDYSILDCAGNVGINDYKHRISIFSTALNYNRNTETIVIDGWVEMQDLNNEVAASAAWFEFDMKGGILKLQIRAKIVKRTDRGAMVCRADSIVFDRDDNSLLLSGNSSVFWDGDEYKAANIQVDLKTEEIKMTGDISGTIRG